jgi:putative tryptophan/tyrosine transport system substrate-binding protein
MSGIRRREFITLLGGVAAAWPLAARAQQPTMPVIGFLHPSSPEAAASRLPAFRQGLREAGFVESENVAIEYGWADGQMDRLPALAADLVRRRATVIVAPGGNAGALAAKAATTTIPIVFLVGEDPVGLGLVGSLARPGSNMTGVNFFTVELAAKRLELLRELVPAVTRVAALVDPNAGNAEATAREVETAARSMGLQIQVLNTSTGREIDMAFAGFARERSDALFVGSGPFFIDRRVQLALLAAHHSVPATYQDRLNAEAGGLMSYGASLTDAYRQIGAYAGRILKGTKAADLPVVQATKIDLVINVQAARVLGLTVPPSLLARADQVIE